NEDYAFQRPSLTAKKLRALELRAGLPSHRGRKGTAAAYSLKDIRRRETALAEQKRRARLPPPCRQLADATADQESRRGRRHRGAARTPPSGKPARRGFHPHPPLFGPGSPAPTTKPNAR